MELALHTKYNVATKWVLQWVVSGNLTELNGVEHINMFYVLSAEVCQHALRG